MKKYKKGIIIVGILAIIYLLTLICFKVVFINKNQVKDIVINDMKVNRESVYFENIDFELDKNLYEIDVYYKNKEYEYKIDAKSGKIIYTDFLNNSSEINNQNKTINKEDAKSIALTNAKLKEDIVKSLKIETDYEDSILIYEVSFTYDIYEYEYKINSNTGEIISFDKDSIYN